MPEANSNPKPKVNLEAVLRIAKAAMEEQRRQEAAEVRLPSPLDQSNKYDFWAGDSDLLQPRPVALDEKVRALCHRLASAGLEERQSVRSSLTTLDGVTLGQFARRSAVFAMRENKPERLMDSLAAVAMTNPRATDFRDISMALKTLRSVASHMTWNSVEMFSEASKLAADEFAKFFHFAEQSPPGKQSVNLIVETAEGPGLLDWQLDFHPYRPTEPLFEMAMETAAILRADKYQTRLSLYYAGPKHWLAKVDDTFLSNALESMAGGAKVTGSLRPEFCPSHQQIPMMAQVLWVSILEMASEEDAAGMLRIAEIKIRDAKDATRLALVRGKVFCLLVARSIVAGQMPFETQESLLRFKPAMRAILDKPRQPKLGGQHD